MIYLASLEEAIEDKLQRYYFIHTKAELAKVICQTDKHNTIIFRSDFISKYFTPTGFIKYSEGIKKINPNILLQVDDEENIISAEEMIRKVLKCRSMEDIIFTANAHEKEFLDAITEMATSTRKARRESLIQQSQISQLQMQNDNLNLELDNLKAMLSNEQQTKLGYQTRYNNLVSRIKYQYGVNYNDDKVFQVSSHKYDKILYFKELSRVQYTDSLVYYLQQILRVMYNMPARVVVIESYYADGKIYQYPKLVPHHQVTDADILSGDILMLGMQPNMMEAILQNASNVSFLIVLDRAGYSQPHIIGDNVEYLYTVSDHKEIPPYLEPMRCITYNPDGNLNIPYVEAFEQLDDSGKMSLYSSMPIVHAIIDLINGG